MCNTARTVLGVTVLALLAACAPAPSAPTPPPASAPVAPTPAAPAEAQPRRGGVFQTIGIRELPHLNPWTNTTANSQFFLVGVYDQLVDYDYQPFGDYRGEYKIVPALAQRWEQRDPTTYVFHLRRDVKWQDGQPFTGKDVKWSYEFILDPANALGPVSNLRGVQSIALLDDYTVQITTKAPDVAFLDGLANWWSAILPQHVHDRGDKFETVAIGTGPFKVESYDRVRGITYARNEDYFQAGRPYLDKWRIPGFQDEAGRTAAFIARQNDVLKVTNRRRAEPLLAQAPNVKSLVYLRDIAPEMLLKLDRPPFNDRRVRQAIHLAIDRQAMVNTLTFGDGLVNPPSINTVRKALAIPQEELQTLPGWRQPKDQDIADAKRLLAEAGYGAGLSFAVRLDQAHPDIPSISEVVSAQLRQIGIDMKIEPMESGVFNRALPEGDYEAVIHTTSYAQPEGGPWNLLFHSSGRQNRMPIRDAELDRLIEAQGREFEATKRRQLVVDLQRLLLREMYVVPLITHAALLLWHPYVNGWVDNQAANVGNLDWSQLWLSADGPRDRL